jgi:RNA polymerase sigma factor (TIGR02999 family)
MQACGQTGFGREKSGSSTELFPRIYRDLQHVAAARLAHEHPGHPLQACDLVDEAWLRVCRSPKVWDGEKHIFGALCRAMRRILVEQARRRNHHVEIQLGLLDASEAPSSGAALDEMELRALEEALKALGVDHPREAELVALRFFRGFTQAQAAEQMGMSRSSADRLWAFTRAWLRARIRDACC